MIKKNTFPCDICGADNPVEIEVAKLYTKGQPLYSCGGCGFVYVRDRRSAEEIARSWSEEIFQKGYTAKIPYVLARQTYVADFIDVTIGLQDKSICDIGAGEGQFLEICRNKSQVASVFGIEPSTYNVGLLAQNKIDNFHGTIEQFKDSSEFQNKKFDIVTIMWTLENCLDCNLMIEIANKMLKDGGHIVVATGSRILVPFKKPLTDYLSANPSDTHCFRFSQNSLYNILSKNHFGNIKLNRYIDGEFLVAIGEKKSPSAKIELRRDNPNLIVEFFERWHSETEWLSNKGLLKYA